QRWGFQLAFAAQIAIPIEDSDQTIDQHRKSDDHQHAERADDSRAIGRRERRCYQLRPSEAKNRQENQRDERPENAEFRPLHEPMLQNWIVRIHSSKPGKIYFSVITSGAAPMP